MPSPHLLTVVLAAFLASLVEFVEALTIVLAVGVTRGWRSSLMGAAGGVVFLAVLTIVAGPALERIPLTTLQLVIGILLLLFGMRWLRKAILRAGGVIGLHDETAIYEKETAALRLADSAPIGDGALRPDRPARLDRLALITSFKAVTLEGLEVIFIVIAAGAGGMLLPAALGATLAGALVIGAGFIVHRPLSRVPENALKFAVGTMLSAFGVFWVGEGLRFPWPGEDLALLGLIGGFLLVSLVSVAAVRSSRAASANASTGAQ
ncbi:MAG: hypothetical protein ABJD11_04330 [Gemmatimonadota bacterium]